MKARKILLVLASILMCSCQKETQWQTDASYIEVRFPNGVSQSYTYWEYSYLGYKEEKESQTFWVKCVSFREDLETTYKYIGCTYKIERKTQNEECSCCVHHS